jgi:hypothetical protein
MKWNSMIDWINNIKDKKKFEIEYKEKENQQLNISKRKRDRKQIHSEFNRKQ